MREQAHFPASDTATTLYVEMDPHPSYVLPSFSFPTFESSNHEVDWRTLLVPSQVENPVYAALQEILSAEQRARHWAATAHVQTSV